MFAFRKFSFLKKNARSISIEMHPMGGNMQQMQKYVTSRRSQKLLSHRRAFLLECFLMSGTNPRSLYLATEVRYPVRLALPQSTVHLTLKLLSLKGKKGV